MTKKERYEFRKQNGLCVWCGKLLDTEGVKCRECREKQHKYRADTREWRKSLGICTCCGKRPAYNGRLCLICKQDGAEYHRMHDKPLSEQERCKRRDYCKKLTARRRENGECTKCGKKLSINSKYVRCLNCRLHQRKVMQERARAAGVMPNDMRGNGVYCACCLKPVENPGSKCCNRCLENNRESIKKAKAASPKDNWFRQVNDYEWRCRIERSEQRKADKIKRAMS